MKKNSIYLLFAGLALVGGLLLLWTGQPILNDQHHKNVVIIDKSLENYLQLADAAADSAQVILVENNDAGFLALQTKISSLSNIERLHILTHGTAGNFVLARQQLNEQNLEKFSGFWKAVKESFVSEKSELFIYSCELASVASGKTFINRLHDLLEVSVAGSEDQTGDAKRGGNWDLEYAAGRIVKNHVLKFLNFQGLLIPSFSELSGSSSPFYQIAIHNDDQLIYGDFDNDGDIDLHVLPPLPTELNKFYRNNGNGIFTDNTNTNNPFGSLTQKAAFGGALYAYVADWDNDGDVDIWTTRRDFNSIPARNIFYKNNNGVFQELKDGASPFNGITLSQDIEFIYGDFDNDGDIDIHTYDGVAATNKFYRNNGTGVFAEVTGAANPFNNLSDKAAFFSGAKYARVADWDNDGDVDIFVSKYKVAGDKVFFRNDNGVFTTLSGAQSPFKDMLILQDTQFIHGDFDADGDVDILAAKSTTTETLDFYQNNGSGSFTLVTGSQNPFNTLPNTGAFLNDAGKAFVADWDNDKDVDVFLTRRTTLPGANIFYRQSEAPPLLSSSLPANGALAVDIESNITLNFSRAVSGVAGKNILVKRTSDNFTFASIDASDTKVTGGGTSSITINPATDLSASISFYILIDKGAFKDADGRIFNGITTNNVVAFTTGTASVAPSLTTDVVSVFSTTSATLGGNVTSDGGQPVTDRGVVWNTTGDPIIDANKTTIGSGAGIFSQSINGLPQGTRIYVRAFATNTKGTSYGNQVDFYTKTTVSSITRINSSPTNASSVAYTVTFAQPVSGVDINDFTAVSAGLTGASISSISGSGTTYTATLNTGSGNGTLRLDFTNTSGTIPTVDAAFTSADSYTIYKSSTATNYFRTQSANADWNQPGSWESSADNSFWIAATDFPGSSAAAVNVLANQTVNLPSGFNASTANLNNGGTVNVNSNTLTVSGTLTNSGKIEGSGAIVHTSFTNSGTIAPGNSPGILSFTGDLVNNGTLDMEIGGTSPGTGHDQILVSGTMTISGTMNVSFINGFTPAVNDEFILIDAASSTGAFSAVNLPVIAPRVWETTYNNVNGTFAIRVLDDPLPVTLVNFDAVKLENNTALSWSTSSETNSSHFEIQRSSESISWETIGSVDASKESSSIRKYTFNDISPMPGENLYRLKMIDNDGSFAYSRIKSLSFPTQIVEISFYPNPVTEKLFLDMKNPGEITKLQIYNTVGTLIYTSLTYNPDGIPVHGIPSGLYILRLTKSNNHTNNHKFLKN